MQTNGHVPWSQRVRWARSFHRELGGASLGASACGVHGYWVKCMLLRFIYARDDQNLQSSYFGVVKNCWDDLCGLPRSRVSKWRVNRDSPMEFGRFSFGNFVRSSTIGFAVTRARGSGVPSGTRCLLVCGDPALETPGYCQAPLRGGVCRDLPLRHD